MKILRKTPAAFVLSLLSASFAPLSSSASVWPEITREARPWAYHWWLGSAVDEENLAKELKRYREGGLGGVHIVPIYGAKGAEQRYVSYLSPRWMELLQFTVEEAARNDMGVDMTTGTGWCFGGPNITEELSTLYTLPRVAPVPAGARAPWKLELPKTTIRSPRLIAATALGPAGERVVLSADQFDADGTIRWQAPADGWKLAFLSARRGVDVKRAAPGGEGPHINPILPKSMETYLERFTAAFAKPGQARPRAMYHDSYEYYASITPWTDGEWSPTFFEDFARLRGYRLEPLLGELAGEGDQKIVGRLRADYRRTVSQLMVDETFPIWAEWCRSRGIRTRNQAHGSVADNFDFYTVADIPECEIFLPDPGTYETPKLASSAAQVMGGNLVSAETGTWLDEHFNETFEQMKRLVDELFVRGVNHIFYHGTVYSPDDAPWPGWLFYASTQMNPRNPLWREAAAFNTYVARVQSVLQAGRASNDVLLYNAMEDSWHAPRMFAAWRSSGSGHARKLGEEFWKRGVQFNWITDRWIARCSVKNGKIQTPGGSYAALVLPQTTFLPLETARHLERLVKEGGTIIFADKLPSDVPGYHRFEERRGELAEIMGRLSSAPGVKVGAPLALIEKAGIVRESVSDLGVELVRREDATGAWYFLFNPSAEKTVDAEVKLALPAAAMVARDPISGREGRVALKGDGTFPLRLEPRASVLLRSFRASKDAPTGFAEWRWTRSGPELASFQDGWRVEFVSGGPSLPAAWAPEVLADWTKQPDQAATAFSGTAVYRRSIRLPAAPRGPVLLDLGKVHDVARVRLDGRDLGVRFGTPYRWEIPPGVFGVGEHALEVEVTNVAANRIRDLDVRKVSWKYFRDANVLSSKYGPLKADEWPVRPAGLLGPVRLLQAE